jgi:UDP-N-acetylglucosamine 1-carboxyvinyltransferase
MRLYKLLCATLLTKDEVVIDNIPNIIDVIKLIDLLSHSVLK